MFGFGSTTTKTPQPPKTANPRAHGRGRVRGAVAVRKTTLPGFGQFPAAGQSGAGSFRGPAQNGTRPPPKLQSDRENRCLQISRTLQKHRIHVQFGPAIAAAIHRGGATAAEPHLSGFGPNPSAHGPTTPAGTRGAVVPDHFRQPQNRPEGCDGRGPKIKVFTRRKPWGGRARPRRIPPRAPPHSGGPSPRGAENPGGRPRRAGRAEGQVQVATAMLHRCGNLCMACATA